MKDIKTLGELKKSNYRSKKIKDELRDNLIQLIKKCADPFPGVIGFKETVVPQLERAILARHNLSLLGLRGQAKTTIARLMVDLLDEYIPVIEGSALNEDPFSPITLESSNRVAELRDKTPIRWMHRSERYTEKLATPDVSVSDLIGDLDPIKASNLKLSFSDEGAIHYGLVPRANRGIFVINELPDLQPRIQVALFNILQEGDIQIRGFKVRLPLDLQFVFTSNPEDYTNRGSIITPLKDRIQSQIITHYPHSIAESKSITRQEASLHDDQGDRVRVPELMDDLTEELAFVARESDFIDQKSGVSVRLSITAYENLIATAELRALQNDEKQTHVRISDLIGAIPAITGKVELVYEGEQEGALQVAHQIIRQTIRKEFLKYFPNPERLAKREQASPYDAIVNWFSEHALDLDNDAKNDDYRQALLSITPLVALVKKQMENVDEEDIPLYAEFVLHALAEYSLISKKSYHGKINFNDMLGSMLG
ncbi:MAG: sigma 54-interacting transcriptional regulator [Salibacteraceae bacterium]